MRATRLTRPRVLLILVSAAMLAGVVTSAQNAPAPLHIEKVKNNLYVITGGRGSGTSSSTVSGNTTVFLTGSGVVLVDTKLPGFGAGILEQVRSVTPKPITMITISTTSGRGTPTATPSSSFPHSGLRRLAICSPGNGRRSSMRPMAGAHPSSRIPSTRRLPASRTSIN